MTPVYWYFILSATLFSIGAFGLLSQRNGIKILMSIELMLNAANINFAAFSSMWAEQAGYTFALFSIAIAAAEAAVGLAILVNVFRVKGSIEVNNLTALKG